MRHVLLLLALGVLALTLAAAAASAWRDGGVGAPAAQAAPGTPPGANGKIAFGKRTLKGAAIDRVGNRSKAAVLHVRVLRG